MSSYYVIIHKLYLIQKFHKQQVVMFNSERDHSNQYILQQFNVGSNQITLISQHTIIVLKHIVRSKSTYQKKHQIKVIDLSGLSITATSLKVLSSHLSGLNREKYHNEKEKETNSKIGQSTHPRDLQLIRNKTTPKCF